ncbi:TetR/AcrR family transcriptional regulator [Rhodobacteraceae bacterium RKSG542]|uniref:TetR/AcrR family transcriptional regulator n=1 Tax=Pseudovibrio flavus TaxID=2529854 RepID=UPI0012BC0C76|nr:TetR/AcrR family transcriptional regulator [Pseudovibrio flavus]MTI17839.1 TetR/AcrR family transcriptional regulator [Pseudovibrio flavus]
MSIAEYLTVQGRAADLLEAGKRSFLHVGYEKSAVSMIAEHSGISMAHIYNFYPSKLDLACAVVGAEIAKLAARLETTVDPNASASARLQDVLLRELTECAELLQRYPGLLSCLAIIKKRRPEFYNRVVGVIRPILETVLRSGNMAEEFEVRDVKQTALLIHSATSRYRYAEELIEAPMDDVRAEYRALTRLLLKGVERR